MLFCSHFHPSSRLIAVAFAHCVPALNASRCHPIRFAILQTYAFESILPFCSAARQLTVSEMPFDVSHVHLIQFNSSFFSKLLEHEFIRSFHSSFDRKQARRRLRATCAACALQPQCTNLINPFARTGAPTASACAALPVTQSAPHIAMPSVWIFSF